MGNVYITLSPLILLLLLLATVNTASLVPRPPHQEVLDLYLHTASDGILEVGMAWEQGYQGGCD